MTFPPGPLPPADLALLRVHGDEAARGAALDFAVNVQPGPPPALAALLQAKLRSLAAYPDPRELAEATAVLAAWHGVPPQSVLLTHGAADAFSLLAQLPLPAGAPQTAIVLHPSFTEPEYLLRQAGLPITRVLATAPFAALPELDHAGANSPETLVVVGNPTNPTGVVHQLAALRDWAEQRTLVIDEAFLDLADRPVGATSRTHPESACQLAATEPNLLVTLSLTKTWGLAGLRCGALIAHPDTIAALKKRRPHWPLGSLQIAAIDYVARHGTTYEQQLREQLISWREHQLAQLAPFGMTPLARSQAPFMLLRAPGASSAGAPDAEQLRRDLAARGIAVRRCDSFPGLDTAAWRLAVRSPAQVAQLTDCLKQLL